MTAAIEVARVFIAETHGVYQPSWTIEEVDGQMGAIHDQSALKDFGLHGHVGHLVHSFAMARGEA